MCSTPDPHFIQLEVIWLYRVQTRIESSPKISKTIKSILRWSLHSLPGEIKCFLVTSNLYKYMRALNDINNSNHNHKSRLKKKKWLNKKFSNLLIKYYKYVNVRVLTCYFCSFYCVKLY